MKQIFAIKQEYIDAGFGSSHHAPKSFTKALEKMPKVFKKKQTKVEPKATELEKQDLFAPKTKFNGLKKISQNDALLLFNQIARIIRDPQLYAKYLKPVDEELARKLPELRATSTLQNVIAGQDHFIAGAWQDGHVPLQKRRVLDEILRKNEQEFGVNIEGAPKFIGFIETEKANAFVKKGNIFAEDEQFGRMLFHGKYSHRLIFEVIR